MRCLFLVSIFFGCVFGLKAQCSESIDTYQVIKKFLIDDQPSLYANSPIYLEPKLDKKSLEAIKAGFAKPYYVRQIKVNNHIAFDTLTLSVQEKRLIDSLFSKTPETWNAKRLALCGMSDFILYSTKEKEANDKIGIIRNSYQLMEPLFLRNSTIALAFYRRLGVDLHSEFSILVKESGNWILWNKIIVLEGWNQGDN